MNKNFCSYNESGEITKVFSGLSEPTVQKNVEPSDYLYVGAAIPHIHWINPTTGERQDRQEMTPSVTTSAGEATLSGLPDPCEVRCLGETEEVTGGTITIEVDEPGTYTVELRSRPQYFDHTLEVEIP